MALPDAQWQALRTLIAEEGDGVSADSIQPDSRLIEDLGYDSLLAASLALEVEAHFDIEIEDADLVGLTSAGELADLVERKLSS